MSRICLHCKRVHHDQEQCPYEQRYRELFSSANAPTDHIEGASPNVFVGRYGYPKVNVGFLAPNHIHEAEIFDAPRLWSAQDFGVPDVAQLRRSLIQSRFTMGVQEHNRLIDLAKEIAMAQKPVDVDIDLHGNAREVGDFDGVSAPFGPTAELKSAQLTSNPSIPTPIEKAVSDTDALASDTMGELFAKSYDEHALTKLLSLGTLGKGIQRKIVPTRWSITAVDDTLGKHLREEIQDYKEAEHQLYFGGYLGNHYIIFLFPHRFSYELFEMNTAVNVSPLPYATDYESWRGRSSYAQETAGGYYACRYPILEKLSKEKQQAAVLALRFITPEYTAPLGVWVVREASRAALGSEPLFCSSRAELLAKAKELVQARLGIDISPYLKASKLLEELSSQKRLFDFA